MSGVLKLPDITYYPDGLDILVCKIEIWEPEDKSVIDTTAPESRTLVIRECESIDIDESYKKLIGTATVKFPRGTVIKKTVTTAEEVQSDGATTVYAERQDNGSVSEIRDGYSTAAPENFSVGQRIRIFLGYYRDKGIEFASTSERISTMEKEAFSKTPQFDGYIVKCSVSTPIEIKCENLASSLKRRNCRRIVAKNATVNQFLSSTGKYKLLNGSGLSLDPQTEKDNYNIGSVTLDSNLTVADVLTEWNKYKLYTFIRYDDNGKPVLRVGRSYESMLQTDTSEGARKVQFDYHVAEDGLTLMHTDPKFLAVAAKGFQYIDKKEVQHSLTVRLNPEWSGSSDTKHSKFEVLNETKLSKKQQKLTATKINNDPNKVDLSKYNVVSYVCPHIGVTRDELIKEAEKYFVGYNMNGIEGTLTLFGDYNTLTSGERVVLLSEFQPEKNGWYIVEEVHTVFGVNGYRQTIKLPYCIARAKEKPNTYHETSK